MPQWKREVFLSIFLIAFSVVNFIYCETMKTDLIKVTAAKPDVYLQLWLAIMCLLSLILLIRALRNRSRNLLRKLWGPLQIFTVVVFALYLLAIPHAGFLVSTLIFMMAVTSVYNLYMMEEIPRGKKLVKMLAAYATFSVIATFTTNFVFRNLLAVNLPTWDLF